MTKKQKQICFFVYFYHKILLYSFFNCFATELYKHCKNASLKLDIIISKNVGVRFLLKYWFFTFLVRSFYRNLLQFTIFDQLHLKLNKVRSNL